LILSSRRSCNFSVRRNTHFSVFTEAAISDEDVNLGSGNSRPVRLCPLARVVTLSKVSNALRVPIAKPLILCIEDEPLPLEIRKKVLEQDGYSVIGVTNAADALTALKEAPVCAIIADHMLQGTTGTELAKEMKEIKPDVPVILFSGRLPERLNNVDVFVNKGEPTASFLSIVRGVVQRYCS
jgi:CheY-like chemotaxis protein